MPLSKAKQAEYMRNYRASKHTLGITHPESSKKRKAVIPKTTKINDIPEIDADGNVIYEEF